MERSEGNMSLKNPVILSGIDPETVQIVTQRLNHYAILVKTSRFISQQDRCLVNIRNKVVSLFHLISFISLHGHGMLLVCPTTPFEKKNRLCYFIVFFLLFHRAFFNSIMDKTPTHALFTQHYISLAC